MAVRLASAAVLALAPALVPLATLACTAGPRGPEVQAAAPEVADGAALFAAHCGVCHGARGGGDGPAAPHLRPAPRDLRRGAFRLVSTRSGAPSDDDLVATLRRGIGGSAMPSFGFLEPAELDALAGHVRELAVEGRTEALLERAAASGETLEAAPERLAARALAPGEPLALGPEPEATPALLARGRELWGRRCGSCHGEDGAGAGAVLWTEDGAPTTPRDFTAGVLRGGADARSLAHRVVAGMPGTPMAANDLPPEDAWALALHARSLVGALPLERGRRTLAARRVAALPEGPDDPAWDDAPGAALPLLPLRWRADAPELVRARALHDGERVALRLAWRDATRDAEPLASPTPDAAAVMLSAEASPPTFAMGAPGRPVAISHWRAWSPGEALGLLDLAAPSDAPHGVGRVDAGGYARGVGLDAEVRALAAAGPGRTHAASAEDGVAMRARWAERAWAVVLVLPRDAGASALAVAVWDGAGGEAGAHKAVTAWHALRVE